MSGEQMDVPYRSIPDMFRRRVSATPEAVAFTFPVRDGEGERIAQLTWAETADRVDAIAAGLIDLGVEPEDRVAIASATRLEWVLVDSAVMCAGAATTTVYPTTSAEEAGYILRDSGSRVLVAEDAAQVAKVREQLTGLADLVAVVVLDGPAEEVGPPVLTLAELEERGRARLAAEPGLVAARSDLVGPDHLATLMYTSGTTGTPKGVLLAHRSWTWEAVAQRESGLLRPDDLQYLWLPLSHCFGKTLLCGQLVVGFVMYVDGRIDRIVANLPLVRPTLMAGAPRIYEKVYARVVATAREAGGVKRRIFSWAMGVGRQVVALRERGEEPAGLLALQYRLADRLVFHRVRQRFGGRMRVLVSGSAALPTEVATFFHATGIPLLEGYGLTETAAGSLLNLPGAWRIGTVGRPLGDLRVRIADDGEVLIKSASVMNGYHNLPAETAEVLDEEGWFRTGDIGELDDDGFLRITDRKKDLAKTSGGKYVAPSHLEGIFKTFCPYASQAVVVVRNYCTMLVALDPEALAGWAAARQLSARDHAELLASPEVRAMVQEAVDRVNARVNRWETIKRFTLLPRELTIEDGELTPSLKVRRRVVEERYAAELDAMYPAEHAGV